MAESGAKSGHAHLHYGWIVLGITFLVLLVSAGIRAAPTVLIVPLEHEFGWTRAAVSFAIAVQLLVYGLVGPFAAGLMDRFGVRRTMVGSLWLMLVGFGLTPFVGKSWELLPLWGLAAGAGTGAAAIVMAAVVANRWFHERRGLVMGLLTGSAAAGQLLFLPLLANIVVDFGWRLSVVVACAVVVITIPPAMLLMRDNPADLGLKPYGQPADAPDAPPPSRANPVSAAFSTLGAGMASRDFWLLSGSFFVCGASTIGLIGTHFIPACLDHGIPEATAAGILAAMGVCNFLGTTASGWLSDRFDSRHLLFWYYALRGLSLLFLPYAFDLSFWGLALFSLFYGLDWIATVPPTVRLTSDVFGLGRAGMMYGWIMVMHQVGSAVAAYGSGLLRTYRGDYFDAFIAAGVLCFIAAVLVLGVGRRSPDRPASRPVLATAEA
jgi:sugar phosphate permease